MWILKIRAKMLLLTERIAGARFGARGVPVAASRARVGVEISAGAAGGRPEGHCGASPGLVLKGEHQKLARQVERRGADWRTQLSANALYATASSGAPIRRTEHRARLVGPNAGRAEHAPRQRCCAFWCLYFGHLFVNQLQQN